MMFGKLSSQLYKILLGTSVNIHNLIHIWFSDYDVFSLNTSAKALSYWEFTLSKTVFQDERLEFLSLITMLSLWKVSDNVKNASSVRLKEHAFLYKWKNRHVLNPITYLEDAAYRWFSVIKLESTSRSILDTQINIHQWFWSIWLRGVGKFCLDVNTQN